ncbi:MAG: zinc-binding dehydrogenase [Nocardioidaceae bacterium]
MPDEVEIAVEGCGICGTDIAITAGTGDEVPAEPHPVTGCCAPMTLGHEIVGKVVAPDGELFGRRVAVWPYVPSRGEASLAPTTEAGHLGMTAHGGMADRLVARAACCVPIADSVPLAAAVLCEPLAVVLRAFRLSGAAVAGRRVAIIGGGSIGLCALDVAWHRGAAEVVVVDPQEAARRAAVDAGASRAVVPGEARGIEAAVVVEASGAASGINTAMYACSPRGVVIVIGDHHRPEPLDVETLLIRELRICGSAGHDFELDFTPAVLAVGRGELGARPRPVRRVSLEQAPDIVLGRSELRTGAKVVVVPTLTSEENR